jgi:hypothetical protein
MYISGVTDKESEQRLSELEQVILETEKRDSIWFCHLKIEYMTYKTISRNTCNMSSVNDLLSDIYIYVDR